MLHIRQCWQAAIFLVINLTPFLIICVNAKGLMFYSMYKHEVSCLKLLQSPWNLRINADITVIFSHVLFKVLKEIGDIGHTSADPKLLRKAIFAERVEDDDEREDDRTTVSFLNKKKRILTSFQNSFFSGCTPIREESWWGRRVVGLYTSDVFGQWFSCLYYYIFVFMWLNYFVL